MKKILGTVFGVLFAGALAGAFVFGIGQEAKAQYAQTPTIGRHFSSTVAAGAIIQTAVLDLSNVNECVAYADNSAGGATRALNANCIADDGTTTVFSVSNTVAIAGRGLTSWGKTVSAATLPTGVVVLPGATCKKMQFTLVAGGAAAGTLAVDCR